METKEKKYWVDYFTYVFITMSLMKNKGKKRGAEKELKTIVKRALELEDYEVADCLRQSITRIKTGMNYEK